MPRKIQGELCTIAEELHFDLNFISSIAPAPRCITVVTPSTTVHFTDSPCIPKLPPLFARQPRVRTNLKFHPTSTTRDSTMAPVIGLSHITNPLATPYQLQNTASQLDRIPGDLEVSIRFEGSRLIQAAGVLLHLPQELIAEAIIIFARFWLGPEGGSLAEYHAKVCMFKGAGPNVALVL